MENHPQKSLRDFANIKPMGARDNKIEIHYIEAKVYRIPTLILTLVKQYYTCSLMTP